MDPRKIVFQETAIVAVGEVICTAAMIGIFFLMGYFNTGVVLGAIVGMVLAIGNFLFMAIGASLAADKAQAQDVKGGQSLFRCPCCCATRCCLLFCLPAAEAECLT